MYMTGEELREEWWKFLSGLQEPTWTSLRFSAKSHQAQRCDNGKVFIGENKDRTDGYCTTCQSSVIWNQDENKWV